MHEWGEQTQHTGQDLASNLTYAITFDSEFCLAHTLYHLESNIFYRFGLLIEIIFDNESTFIYGKFTQYINKLGVKHFTSSTYCFQGIGKVESTNTN